MSYPKSYQKLIEQFLKFPTVGPRTAGRFVSYLIKLPKEKIEELIKSIEDLKRKIKFCAFCFNPFEPSTPEEIFCSICQDSRRDKTLLCIVEKEVDLISIENTRKYKGLYFILGGTLPLLKKANSEKIRIKELKDRIKNPKNFGPQFVQFKEVIIATNPTPEGEATAEIIKKELKNLFGDKLPKITKLGKGLPLGGELEYADEETLSSALESRK